MESLRHSVCNQAPSNTSEVVSLIIEFLQFHNFAQTLQALELEWKASEAQGTGIANSNAARATDVADLMVCIQHM